ncbi:hypothetical protein GCM10010435_32720 [Winogradskya consettensis]|uniref:Methyltransferase FkbM domain-containing protein n=1 Tax=Winogradskya consettensis TaxID=113560 RepID=A0A919VNQ5_9ACTN|nr:FkbM family methyltransferase [Actinoplanes consettensis]GIM70150.1 hypothetical protein Aco04nite_18770 [Actinoplanes consettensis]
MTDLLGGTTRQLRRAALFLLSRANPGDVTIRHHYTADRIRLHSFRHKGYWFHGRRRERDSMECFGRLIGPGDCVVEAGGHIGYISLYFSQLVGAGGSVHVFEPGSNNLPYVDANVGHKSNVTVTHQALGSAAGALTMHVEDLTGQNNSLVANFAGLAGNERNAIRANITQELVEVTTIDAYVGRTAVRPTFIKIDVEGFEWEVLQGAAQVLDRDRPVLMVEVQSHRAEIAAMLHGLGYQLYEADGHLLTEIPDNTVNVFALPEGRAFPTH